MQCALRAALGAAWLGCGPAPAGENVAEVDRRPVLLSELRREVDARFEADPDALLADVLTQELDRLVNEQVALGRALELGIEISEAEVSARMRLVHGDEPIDASARYREVVRRQMMIDRAAIVDLASTVRIQESALVEAFERRRDQFARPERVKIRQIVVQDAALARALRQELSAGADFGALAAAHSAAPEAQDRGMLPPFATGEMPEVFDRAFELRAGEVSGVIESPHGYHIFALVERLPAEMADLADVREELMSTLTREKLMALRPAWLRDLRRSATIHVNERLLETLRR
jgi:parvulin-like peptidyl-prolyl isomerase